MLLLIVFALFTIANIWIFHFYNTNDFNYKYNKDLNLTKKQKFLKVFDDFMEDWWGIIVLFIATGIIGIGSCAIAFVCNYACSNSELAYKQAKYDVIIYQLENEMYSSSLDAGQLQVEDSNGNLVDSGKVVIGYGQRELMEDVSDWNSWLSHRNVMEKNVWVGAFYPKWSDKLKLIDLSQY